MMVKASGKVKEVHGCPHGTGEIILRGNLLYHGNPFGGGTKKEKESMVHIMR